MLRRRKHAALRLLPVHFWALREWRRSLCTYYRSCSRSCVCACLPWTTGLLACLLDHLRSEAGGLLGLGRVARSLGGLRVGVGRARLGDAVELLGDGYLCSRVLAEEGRQKEGSSKAAGPGRRAR